MREALFEMEKGLFAFLGPLESCLLAKEFEERQGVLSEFCDKTGEQGEHTIQDLYGFFHVGVGRSEKARHLSGLASIPRSFR